MNNHCMIRGDGNEMMSIYSGVCRIYTPHHSVQLHCHCIFVQLPSHLDDVRNRECLRGTWRRRSSELRDAPGGRHSACLDLHLETGTE